MMIQQPRSARPCPASWASRGPRLTNNSSKAIALEGSITQTWNGQTIDCQPSVLNAGFTRGCYNHQMPIQCGRNTTYGDLRVNGVWNRTASKHHDWNPPSIYCP